MSFVAPMGIGSGFGFGGGARIVYISDEQVAAGKMTMYTFQNTGFAPVDPLLTDESHLYVYHNVGFQEPDILLVDEARLDTYKNVINRPAGSGEELPPSLN